MVILQFVIALVTADDSISDQQDANFQCSLSTFDEEIWK